MATFYLFNVCVFITWVYVLDVARLAAAVCIRGDHTCMVDISTGQATNCAAVRKALAVSGAPPAVHHHGCVKLRPRALVPGHSQVAGMAVQVQPHVLRNTWNWSRETYRNIPYRVWNIRELRLVRVVCLSVLLKQWLLWLLYMSFQVKKAFPIFLLVLFASLYQTRRCGLSNCRS